MKWSLLFILATLSRYAQVKHIVVEIDGTIVQKAPERIFKEATFKEKFLNIELKGARYYFIYPGAVDLLSILNSSPNAYLPLSHFGDREVGH